MRRLAVLISLVAMSSLTFASPVLAATLDQSQVLSDSSSFYQPHNLATAGATGVAQTFTAGLGGELSLIELELRRFVEAGTTEALNVEIRAGDPTGPLLASASVPAASIPETFTWIPISFGTPATLTAGDTYAIVLPPGPFTGATDPAYLWTIAFADVYVTGVAWDHYSDSGVWQSYFFGSDRTFRTFVSTGPPTNDDASSPTVIGSLPFTDGPYDTTEATADSEDPDCFGSGSNASVWYAFTTGADPITLLADTVGSNYETQIAVMTGSPTGDIVMCGFGGLTVFPAEPNTTYYLMVAACFNVDGVGVAAIGCDPDATGGELVFSLNEGPPPPEVDITVNPVGHFDKFSGSATISGTVTCTGQAEFTGIRVQLTQTVGRFTIAGLGFLEPGFICDGTTQAWSVEVIGSSGQFKGGRAASVTEAFACNEFICDFDSEERFVKLRG